MKNVFYVFIALFLGANIFADSLIVRNPTEHTNTVRIYDVYKKHGFEWTLEKGKEKSMTLGHDMYLQLVIMNEDKVGICQVHLTELKYYWYEYHSHKFPRYNYQPLITWTDCPSGVIHSSFDQRNWHYKYKRLRPEGPSYSTVTVDNIY
jgi:hypothetical protein